MKRGGGEFSASSNCIQKLALLDHLLVIVINKLKSEWH